MDSLVSDLKSPNFPFSREYFPLHEEEFHMGYPHPLHPH